MTCLLIDVYTTGKKQLTETSLRNLLLGAHRSIYLRTEALELVPAANELAQASQRQVAVAIELPLQAGFSAADSRLPRILMDLGAVVTFRSEATNNYRGTLLIVDGNRFLYSASPLTVSPPGTLISYVSGPIAP